MTVRCLTQSSKNRILGLYKRKLMNQKELAEYFNVSERTINRVFIEAGVATPVERIKGEAYQVMQLLKKHAVDLQKLSMLLETHAPV